jgi:excisionase family DNA binding protein
MNHSDERLAFTIDEAAQALSLSRSTMKAAIRSGTVPAIRMGRRVMIPKHGLLELIGAPPMVASRQRSYEEGVTDERSRITDLLLSLLAQVRAD